jgi:hypothetical protein
MDLFEIIVLIFWALILLFYSLRLSYIARDLEAQRAELRRWAGFIRTQHNKTNHERFP